MPPPGSWEDQPMTGMTRNISRLGILLALATGSHAAAQTRTDRGWQVELTGLAAQSTTGSFGGYESSAGFGLGLDYRISPRLGVELDVLSSELEDEITFGFFDEALTIETNLRMTPVLAGLEVHLTPGRRADLYLGPVLGLMRYDDIEIEF